MTVKLVSASVALLVSGWADVQVIVGTEVWAMRAYADEIRVMRLTGPDLDQLRTADPTLEGFRTAAQAEQAADAWSMYWDLTRDGAFNVLDVQAAVLTVLAGQTECRAGGTCFADADTTGPPPDIVDLQAVVYALVSARACDRPPDEPCFDRRGILP